VNSVPSQCTVTSEKTTSLPWPQRVRTYFIKLVLPCLLDSAHCVSRCHCVRAFSTIPSASPDCKAISAFPSASPDCKAISAFPSGHGLQCRCYLRHRLQSLFNYSLCVTDCKSAVPCVTYRRAFIRSLCRQMPLPHRRQISLS
jgi:hypothetical protein